MKVKGTRLLFTVFLIAVASLVLLSIPAKSIPFIETETTYSDIVALGFQETATYRWTPENPGNLQSLQLSGNFSIAEGGSIRAYLLTESQRLLVFDSYAFTNHIRTEAPTLLPEINDTAEEENDTVSIRESDETAEDNVTFDEEQNGTSGTDGITDENETVSDSQNEATESALEAETEINDSSDETPELALPETADNVAINSTVIDINETNITNSEVNTTTESDIPIDSDTTDNLTSNSTNNSSDIPIPDLSQKNEIPPWEPETNETDPVEPNSALPDSVDTLHFAFEDICADTCDLNLYESAYSIVIEIENAEIDIETITYTINEPTFIARKLREIKSRELPKGNYIMDLAETERLTVGDYDLWIDGYADYTRVNIVDMSGSNYITYHFTEEKSEDVLSLTGSDGTTKTVALSSIPVHNKKHETKEYRYNDKVESVLEDSEYLTKNSYNQDGIPVIVTLDLERSSARTAAVQSGGDSFQSAKSALLAELDGSSAARTIAAASAANHRNTRDLQIINAVAINIEPDELSALRRLGIVERVSLDKEVHIVLDDSVDQIRASDVWQLEDSFGRTITGINTTIAVIDTGIDYTHPDLGGCLGAECKVLGGYDFVNKDPDPMDDHGHGTHCAGIAAGNGVLKGVAPDAKLYGYKVLDRGGSGTYSQVIAGIQRATDPNNDGDFSDHADVLSMSLGGGGHPDDDVSRAVDTAVERGSVVVVAAGNNGPNDESIGSPGVARKALTVGASCKPDQIGDDSRCDEAIARFSSRGPSPVGDIKPDVVAPGVMICSAQWGDAWSNSQCLDDDHTAISGTSMSTPHVAGAAALLVQAHSWEPEDIKSALMLTANDLGFRVNTQGAGEVNVRAAYSAQLSTYPQSVSFGNIRAGKHFRTIAVSNHKDSDVTATLFVTYMENELGDVQDLGAATPRQLNIGANSNAVINLTIDPPSEAQGLYEGQILILSEGSYYRVPFSFVKLSNLTVHVEAEQKLYPDLLIHNDDITVKKGLFQGYDVSGDSHTFSVRSGNYTVYAAGDFEDAELEYMLMGTVEVPVDSDEEITLSLSDARPFTIKARSLDGNELKLYEWERAFVSYHPDNGTIGYSYIDPTYGDRTVYISNKPDNQVDTDVFFKYHGIPSDTPFEGYGSGKIIS
ncbi:MAG: S8 family serine peptidase [archaeon]